MNITHIRRIGERLKKEIPPHLSELRNGPSLGRGAGGDVTHLIDKRVEDIIIEELERVGEPVTLVSEECGVKNINGGGANLLIDPIDGSRNAVSGVPIFSTSIAVVEGETMGDTTAGYVLNIMTGDEFWAIKGQGSFFNGEAIQTQKDDTMRVIAFEAQSPSRDIPAIQPLISRFNRARCFGSTALDLAFLAQGAVSVFVVPSPSRSFDFAAGCLLVREAGGVVTDIHGVAIDAVAIGVQRSSPLLAAANQDLHGKALSLLNNLMRH